MHTVFQAGCKNLVAVTAMLNCRPFPSWKGIPHCEAYTADLEREIRSWEDIFGQHRLSLDTSSDSRALPSLLSLFLPPQDDREKNPHFGQLQSFFNDSSRAQSLLITEEAYVAAVCAWFESFQSSAR